MNLQDINRTIITGQFTNDELNSISDAIRFVKSQLISKNRGVMVTGTNVKFTCSRTGALLKGQVAKVNRKFIMVKVGATTWRVPANMLTNV